MSLKKNADGVREYVSRPMVYFMLGAREKKSRLLRYKGFLVY